MQGLPALIYIPIRPDVTVAVQMPWDLTTAEARKVKTVLAALAGPPREGASAVRELEAE